MANVILHIGAPKTGTSAIQFFLNSNRKVLEKLGFFYPEHGVDKNNVSGGHGGFFSFSGPDEDKVLPDRIQECIKYAESRGLKIIFSAEAFYANPGLVWNWFAGHNVRVVGFVRDPVEFVFSSYNQSIKRNGSTVSLNDFVKNLLTSNKSRYDGSVFFDWLGFFGSEKVTIFPYYKKCFVRGSIECSFLRCLGIKDSDFRRFKFSKGYVNVSYNSSSLELKRLLNYVLKNDESGWSQKVDRYLQGHSDRFPDAHSSKKIPVSPELLSKLYACFEEANKRILEHLVSEECGDFLKGSENFEPGESVSFASVAKLSERLFAELPDLELFLREKVNLYLVGQRSTFSVLKLFDLLRIPVSDDLEFCGFSERSLMVFRKKDVGAASYLRELGAHLIAFELYEEASNVLVQARDLRPEGKLISDLLEDAKRKVISKGES